MFQRLIQAAMLTLLLHLIANLTQPDTQQPANLSPSDVKLVYVLN
ncbi:hypothetical protein [Moorena producens]